MHHWNSDPGPWYIVPVKPGAEASFRRWNFVIISILAALVLALFVWVIVPQAPGSAAHRVSSKIDHHVS
jgi:hypothetical protein